MAARKLAAEIDRTLKKVAEGVEQFESLYEKMQMSQNQTQKEKMESDLKTQIKKLQRLRDQIKTWQQSNDIKDKKSLLDNRRLIELQMEKFKACEKEMKTKAFSKEGLIAAQRLDPAEKAKVEAASWLSSQVDELGRQIESTEAEVETMQVGGSKKKKAAGVSAERTATLEHLNERRDWHIGRLEILHRMVENGTLEPERIDEIKEDISYFVESNGDEEFEEDEGIYDDFDLDEQEEAYGLKGEDEGQSDNEDTSIIEETPPPAKPAAKEAPKRKESEPELPKREEKKSAPGRKASDPSVRSPADTKAAPPVPPVNFAAAKQNTASAPSNVTSPPKAPAAAALPPIRYAAAAAAAVSSPTNGFATAATPISAAPSAPTSAIPAADVPTVEPASTGVTPEPVTAASPAPSHAPSQATTLSVDDGPSAPPGLARANNSARTSPSLADAPARTGTQEVSLDEGAAAAAAAAVADGSPSVVPGQSPSIAAATGAPGSFKPASLAGTSGAAAAVQPTGGAASAQQKGAEARLPSSLADLVTSFESAKMKSLNRDDNNAALHKSLESSFMSVPEPLDSEKPKYYVPKNPFPTPAYYPQAPLPIFDSATMYSKFDEDTLFYIFYYQQGTYHQYLASKELKKQSWRFHKQFLTWFRRHSEPQVITDEYEQGVYVYFDWEGSWAQRKKSDFRFEYRWLED